MKIVADCFVEKNGKVLLVKAGYRDHWQFPGGHAEIGETPYQTAAREVREEVGTSIQVTRLLVLNAETNEEGEADTLCFLFAGTYNEQLPIILQESELAEFCWMPFNEAILRVNHFAQQLFSHALYALESGSLVYLEDGRKIE